MIHCLSNADKVPPDSTVGSYLPDRRSILDRHNTSRSQHSVGDPRTAAARSLATGPALMLHTRPPRFGSRIGERSPPAQAPGVPFLADWSRRAVRWLATTRPAGHNPTRLSAAQQDRTRIQFAGRYCGRIGAWFATHGIRVINARSVGRGEIRTHAFLRRARFREVLLEFVVC